MNTPLPENEAERLLVLDSYKIMDTPPEPDFDGLTRLAAEICGTPISLISLLDRDRQWFKSKQGLEASQTARSISFCQHAIMQDEIFEVEDASKDQLFNSNPLVTGDPSIRFYAGAPLTTPSGYNLGTLCVIDQTPRKLSEKQRTLLYDIRNQVIALMELRIQGERMHQNNRLLALLNSCQKPFIRENYHPQALTTAVRELLEITESQFGILTIEENGKFKPFALAPRTQPQWLIDNILKYAEQVCLLDAPIAVPHADQAIRGVNNLLIVPLLSNAGMTGVLFLANRTSPFPRSLVDRMHTTAPTFGALLEAYKLHNASKKIQIKLTESELQQRLVLKGSALGTWDWNVKTGSVSFNERWANMLGFKLEELEGNLSTWDKLIHPDDKALAIQSLNAHLNGETDFYQCEHRLRTKDGQWKWILDRGEVVERDSDGKPLRACGTHFDVTDRKDAELALVTYAERLKTINSISADVEPGIEWQINTMLTTVCKLMDFEVGIISQVQDDQYLVKYSTGIVEPGTSFTLDDTFCSVILTQGKPLGIRDAAASPEFSKYKCFDELKWRTYLGAPLLVGDTTVGTVNFCSTAARKTDFSAADMEFMTLISRHISGFYQQDLAQTALAVANQELIRSNRELDEFAYCVAHDLKAPLRAIKSLASWIMEDNTERLSAESQNDLQKLKDRAERMSKLLEDLLEFSLLGSQKDKHEPVETEVVVEDVISLVSDGTNFTFSIEKPLPTVILPRALLEKVFRNLICNAMKHHDQPKGNISISSKCLAEGLVEFCVADDGPGIPKEFQQKIFKVFTRLKSQDDVEGSGLGLAMVKKTIESLGGDIRVESQGRGSRFIFTLPTNTASAIRA